uniref:tetratricopeptide repeat protein n=1 Tax=Flavobacterium sp. TaxID=239 RepID=UPI0037C0753D
KTLENASKISIAKYNKGNCFILSQQNVLAEQSFKEALQIAKKVNAKSLEAFALKGIAQIYTLNGAYLDAINELNLAFSIANNVNDLVLNKEIYKGLSENYLALNNPKKYQEYQQKLTLTQTKLKENERASIENLLLENYNNLENKSKTEFSSFWIIVFLSMGVAIPIIFFFISKNANNSIRELKAKINKINSKFLR